jgi:hypothetical protein
MAKEVKPSFISMNVAPPLEGRVQAAPRKGDGISIRLEDSEALDHLTLNSKTHLVGRIQDFTSQVIGEAKAIEQREHAGKGPPEVTAAHIDEAWWVIRRRIRGVRHPVLTTTARAFETFGAAGIGVGATAFQKKWGPIVFIVSCLITMGAFLLEAYSTRRD